jgi:hypothetical protein
MHFPVAILNLRNTIHRIDQMYLSNNEVQQMNCKNGENSNEQSHIYAEADQILERYAFHARGWYMISRTNIYR